MRSCRRRAPTAAFRLAVACLVALCLAVLVSPPGLRVPAATPAGWSIPTPALAAPLTGSRDARAERLRFATGRFVVCLGSAALGAPQPQARIAVIVVHGYGRDEDASFAAIAEAARTSGQDATTVVLAPRFKAAEDAPGPDEHFWSTEGWPSGDLSQDSREPALRLSSFAVVDRLFAELSNPERFPGLQRIVLAGHSAGGQYVSRYVAVGRAGDDAGGAGRRLEHRFVVANPSSYLYLDERRPVGGTTRFEVPAGAPATYNLWRHGLERRNSYARHPSPDEIKRNVLGRTTYYLVGSADDKQDRNLSRTPASMAQGRNRYERWEHFRRYVALFPEWGRRTVFAEVPGVGHSGRQMLTSREARRAIFE